MIASIGQLGEVRAATGPPGGRRARTAVRRRPSRRRAVPGRRPRGRRGPRRDRRGRPRPRPRRRRDQRSEASAEPAAPSRHAALLASRSLRRGGPCAGQLAGRLEVGQRPGRARVVGHHGLAVARRLGDPHRARDRGAQHLRRRSASRTSSATWAASRVRRVVHRQQDRRDVQPRVEVRLDQLDGLEQLAEPLERVVLALDRDAASRRPATSALSVSRPSDGGQSMKHVVEPAVAAPRATQVRLAAPGRSRDSRATSDDQLDLGAGQVDGGGHARTGRRCPAHGWHDLGERQRRRRARRRSTGRPARGASTPRAVEALPCGSRSMTRTRSPCRASAAAS